VLRQEMEDWTEVFLVAPDQEKSATSLALTLHHPLRVKSVGKNSYAVDGTPADCVYLAVQKLMPRIPQLLVSGLNHGPNLGQQDISYSGTVAGAIQGAFLGIPSLAVSVLPDEQGRFQFQRAAGIVRRAAEALLGCRPQEVIAFNMNIPSTPLKGIRTAKLGEKRYNPEVIEKKDPRGRLYYWIGTGNPKEIGGKETDVNIVKEGFITITPLHRDLTDYRRMKSPDLKAFLTSLENYLSVKKRKPER